MRDFVRINRLTENDFTEMFEAAGGARFSHDDSKQQILNADYVIDNVIVELKLVEEEGFEKEARQNKLSNLFVKYDDSPVVVIDPNLLSDEDQKKYYNILEGPIKTHVKKASKQLKSTYSELEGSYDKILLIVNNGYSALSMNEFKERVEKCVKNDTNNIDYVICCGVYYYSDGFDSYVIAPFEIEGIYDKTEPREFRSIQKSWHAFLNQYMTRFITEPDREKNSRLPVLDLEFEVGKVTFVKPVPPFGKESEFWVAGRPRINSSGIDVCPAVGLTFPKMSRKSWSLVRGVIEDSWKLKSSYEEWIKFSQGEENAYTNNVKPFVPVSIEHEALLARIKKGQIACFSDLCNYVNAVFSDVVREIIFSSRKLYDTKIELDRYILLINREIGRDKKNDLCSIYVVRNIDQPEFLETLIENEKIFFEHGLSLAAAYALKKNISMVLHYTDKKYAWV